MSTLREVTATLVIFGNKSFSEAPETRALVESGAPWAGSWARVMKPEAAPANFLPHCHQGIAKGPH